MKIMSILFFRFCNKIGTCKAPVDIHSFPSLWTHKMDTQNIRSHLLKKHALKMDAHIVLLNRTLMLYLYNGHAKWTLNKGGVRYDSLYSRACHFLQMPEEADRAPSGIWDISRSLSCLEDAAP